MALIFEQPNASNSKVDYQVFQLIGIFDWDFE